MGNCGDAQRSVQQSLAPVNIDDEGKEGRRMTARRIAVTTGQEDFSDFTQVKHEKPEETVVFLAAALADTSFFGSFDENTLRELAEQMFKVHITEGEDVIVQGDEGDLLFIVESGHFNAFLRASDGGDDSLAGSYDRGCMFGELAVLYNSRRAASIRCTTSGALWALNRRAFRGTVSQSQVEGNDEFLKAVDVLRSLSDAQRAAIARCMVSHTYKDGEYIVKKGDVADALYFIKAGQVSVSMHEPGGEILRLHAGSFFGENAVNTAAPFASPRNSGAVREDQKRSANVVAVGRVLVLQLLASDFHKLIGDLAAAIEINFSRKVIDSIPLFSALTDKQRSDFAAELRVVHFSKGDAVVKEGESAHAFYIVKAGTMALTQHGEELEKLGPTGFFGERELLAASMGTASSATVSALTEQVVLYSITADRFASAVGSLDEMIAAVEAQVRQREALAGQSRIELSQLEMMRTLGVGTFGRVRLVRDRKSGRPYALKLLDKRQVVHHRQEAHLLQEKQLLLLCHHPFIIELACTFQTETHLYMLMEVCLGGELFSRLKKMGSLPDADAKFYVACIVSAFSYMHQRRIAYRDLKPENILLDAQGYCKIVDFGFAKQILDRSLTLCGTPEYLAPEIILNKSHDIGVDWWTVGILAFELLAGYPPFTDADPMTLYQKIVRAKLRFPSRFSTEAKALITKLVEVNPAIRIGVSTQGQEVKEQPWFAGIDWALLEAKELKSPFVPIIKNPFDGSHFDQYDEAESEDQLATISKVVIPPGTFDAF